MNAVKAKLALWSKDKWLVRLACILAALLLALLVTCCISIFMRSNIQKKYSSAIDQMQAQGYQHMTAMTELFSRIDDPDVDVRNKLIPELKSHYTGLSTVNAVLLDCGRKHALLSPEQTAAFDAAFELYTAAYRQGSATGLARADMAACIEDVQVMVAERNAPAENDQEDVVIINASSGKIENAPEQKDQASEP